jgi:hypothetical protein
MSAYHSNSPQLMVLLCDQKGGSNGGSLGAAGFGLIKNVA